MKEVLIAAIGYIIVSIVIVMAICEITPKDF